MEITQLIILIIGVTLGFYIQTVSGFGAALIAIPIIVSVMDLKESVALMSVFFFIFSIVLIFQNRNSINKRVIIEMSIGITIGLVLGILILSYGSPKILKKVLGIFILLFVGYSYIKKKKLTIFSELGVIFGFIGGLFSGLFSTGGPLFVVYIYNKLDKPNIMRATLIGTLAITNFIRLPLLIFTKILTYNIFLTSLYVLPFFFLALYLGHKTYSKIKEQTFKHVVMIILVLSGASLIIR